jgi:hypothetical protein
MEMRYFRRMEKTSRDRVRNETIRMVLHIKPIQETIIFEMYV